MANDFSLRQVVERVADTVLYRITKLSDPIVKAVDSHPTNLMIAVQSVCDGLGEDMALLFQELMETFPAEDELPDEAQPQAATATPAEWLRYIAALKQRLTEASVRMGEKITEMKLERARHTRKEDMFKYIKEQLQHEIVLLRAERGMTGDPSGAFATLDLLLVLGDSASDKETVAKIQDLIGMLTDRDNRVAAAEGGLLAATSVTTELREQIASLNRQLKILSEKHVSECTKLKIAVLTAEKNNSALAAEVNRVTKLVEVAREQAAAERVRASTREAEKDAIELQLIKLRQDQHAETEQLYVQLATLAMKVNVENARAKRKWTVDPDQECVDAANLIAASGKAPFTNRKVLEQLLAVAYPADDPKLVSTHLAQRQRIDTLLQEVEVWREAAGVAARGKDLASVHIAELEEDVNRLMSYMAEKGVPVPPLQTVRERAMDSIPEPANEALLRHLVSAMRTEAKIDARVVRGVASRMKAIAMRAVADAPIPSQSGALDNSMASEFDVVSDSDADEDDTDTVAANSKNARELRGLGRMVARVERRTTKMRELILALCSEIIRLRETAATNNAGMFEERQRWQEAWDKLLAELPPAIGAKLRTGLADGLRNRAVQEALNKAVRESTEALAKEAESLRSNIAAEERRIVEEQFSAKEAQLREQRAQFAAEAAANASAFEAARQAAAAAEAKASKLAAQLATLQQAASGKKGGSAVTSTGAKPSSQTANADKKSDKSSAASTPSLQSDKRPTPKAAATPKAANAGMKVMSTQTDRVGQDAGTSTDPVRMSNATTRDEDSQTARLVTADAVCEAAIATPRSTASSSMQTVAAATGHAGVQTDVTGSVAGPQTTTTVGDEDDLKHALEELQQLARSDGLWRMPLQSLATTQSSTNLPRCISCPSCGVSSGTALWGVTPTSSVATQCHHPLVAETRVAFVPTPHSDRSTSPIPALALPAGTVPPSRAVGRSVDAATTSIMEATIQGLARLDEVPPPPTNEWKATPGYNDIGPTQMFVARPLSREGLPPTPSNALGSSRRPLPSLPRTNKEIVRRISDSIAPLVDAVAQTVEFMANEAELREFAERVHELEGLLVTMTRRAEAADRELVKARKSQSRLPAVPFGGVSHAPDPNFAHGPPVKQRPTTVLSHKEQMLARSLSPPHPMYHHSLASVLRQDAHNSTAGQRSSLPPALTPTPVSSAYDDVDDRPSRSTAAQIVAANKELMLPKIRAVSRRGEARRS